MSTRRGADESTKVHLSSHDFEVLVDWIEIKANFISIYGTDKKLKVGGRPKQKKVSAFEAMASYLHSNSKNDRLPKLTGEQMQNRWRTYMRKFRATLTLSLSGTGLGLTSREMESGLTIEDKLERKCPQFQRMKDIFGGKPNVKPADILQLGLPAPISEHLCAADAEHGRNEDEVAGEGILVQGGGGDSDAPTEYSEDLLCEDKTSSCQGSPNILHEPLPLLSPGDCTDLSRDLVSTSDVFSDAQSDCQKAPNSRPKVPIRTGRTDLALRLFGISSSSESDGEGYHENQPPTRSQPCAEQPTRLGIKPKRSNSKGLPYEAGTKRVRDDQRNTSKEASRKKSRTTTHQNNLSLAETHLNVSLQKQKMQQGFMYDQLEFTKKKWYEEKEEKQNQREMDRERREQESASRKATERHQFLVALIKKDKSASEIKELLAIYDAGE